MHHRRGAGRTSTPEIRIRSRATRQIRAALCAPVILFCMLSLASGCGGQSSQTQPPSSSPGTWSVAGNISPVNDASGTTVTLTGAANSTTTPDSSGNYTFTGLADGSYTITASKPGFSFSPASQSVTMDGANVTGKNFTASQSSNLPEIASVFFGMQQTHYKGCDQAPYNFPLFDAPAGTYRVFGACNTLWAEMNPAQNSFDFSGLDILLSALRTNGINDAFIVLGDTPNWISSNPTDAVCDQAGLYGLPTGMCDPPSDLNPDGTGTDLAWRSFVTALLQHVTASGYSSTHAHIQLYEIWDEFERSDTINNASCALPRSGAATCSYRGTFAQMLRMTEDLRCIVEGHGSDPIVALKTTCAQDGTMPARGLDPTAMVTEGDAGGESLDNGNGTMLNYLYCNNSPPPNSMCNYGDAGSAATDFVSGHSYFVNGSVPEDLMAIITAEKTMLSPADAAKPYITGEGSWGKNTAPDGSPSVSDPELQGAFVSRWYLVLLMLNVSRGYWYAWDQFQSDGVGGLWSPTTLSFPPLECTTPDQTIGGYDCSGAIAYEQTAAWLLGANAGNFSCPGSCANPTSGVFTVSLTRSGGYQAQIVWDSSPVSACANPQCGSIPFTNSLPFSAIQWRDLAGDTHEGLPSSIGAAPIIIENMANPAESQSKIRSD